MPYFITDDAEGCDGFATIKDDGVVIGCHDTKQEAIDQMIAVSIAEDIEPGGERIEKKKKMKTIYRVLPDNYRPSLSEDVPEGRACGNCIFYKEDDVKEFANGELRAWCEKWDDYVNGAYYCNAWRANLEEKIVDEELEDEMEEDDDAYYEDDESEERVGTAEGPGGGIKFDEATTQSLRNKVKEHNEDMKTKGRPDWTRTTLGQLKAVYKRGAGAWDTSHRPGIGRQQWAMARVNAYLFLLRRGRPQNPKYVTDNDLLPKGHPRSTRSFEEEINELRQVNLEPPAYMKAAARRGLQYYAEGLAGDGLTDKTVREARLMIQGQVSEDKWVRIGAWIARHMPDLDAPQNSNPSDDGYPGGGLVAHLLWGSGPSKRAAQRTMEYAQGVVERIRAEEDSIRYKSIGIKLNQKEKDKTVNSVERRVQNNIDFEIRMEPQDNEGMRFAGYAAVFNSPSEPLPFIETIEQGAFKRSLKSRNEVKMFMNHNMDMVLASTRSKTLRLSEDSKGLLAEAILPDTTVGRDLSVLMKRGDVHSMSFGFSVPPKGDMFSKDGMTRQLKEIRLHEVSIVTGFPAYEATTANVRSLDILATRTNVDVDALADALNSLEAGLELKTDQAGLINEVVAKLTIQPINDVPESLEIKRQQLNLLMKAV